MSAQSPTNPNPNPNSNPNPNPNANASNKRHIPAFDNALSEDEIVVKTFLDTVQSKLDHGILKAPRKHERQALEQAILYPGAYIGTFVGITTFFALRKGPLYIVNRFMSKQQQHNNSSALNKKQTKGLPSTNVNAFKEPMAFKSLFTVFDGALAIATGLFAWGHTVDKKKILDISADLPLRKGRSEISDTLCNDFIDIYRHDVKPDFWMKYSDDTLSALKLFCENCEKRRLFERRLRRDYGLGINDEVELPTRVPEDIVREERERFGGAAWAGIEEFDDQEQDTFQA